MINVQQLLDSHGPPPTEVCLDWAWQLLQVQESSPAARTPTGADWSHWCLTEDGRLKAFPEESAVDSDSPSNSASSPAARQPSLGHLIAQLLDWAGAEWEDGADRLSRETQFRAFHQLLAGCRATEPIRTEPIRSVPTVTPLTTAAKVGRLASTANAVSERKSPIPRKQPAKAPSRIKHFAIGLAVPLAFTLSGLYWFSSNSDGPSPASKPDSSSSNSSSARMVVAEEDAFQAAANEDRLATDLVVSSTAEYDPDPSQASSQWSPSASLATIADSLVESGSDSFGGDAAVTDSPDREPPRDISGSKPDHALSDSSATDGKPLEENASGDPGQGDGLLSDEVGELLRSAEPTEPMIRDIALETESILNTKIPAQLVATDQMLQLQRLPERMRVREPYWQLRLVVSDHWTIQPKEPQGLSEKAVVRWTLLPQDVDGRDPQEVVQVLVQAQLSPRSPDLRWSIAAHLPELPSILVPLDAKKLDAMLVTLMQFQQRTATAIDLAKAQSGQPGLPRPLRSSLLNQRKALESQSKLLEQLQRLVADAGSIASRLGESIEVHGQLTDMAHSGQPQAILQMGEGAGGP